VKLFTAVNEGRSHDPNKAEIAWDEQGRLRKASSYVRKLYVKLWGKRDCTIPEVPDRKEGMIN
jgi:hypothetical protein